MFWYIRSLEQVAVISDIITETLCLYIQDEETNYPSQILNYHQNKQNLIMAAGEQMIANM